MQRNLLIAVGVLLLIVASVVVLVVVKQTMVQPRATLSGNVVPIVALSQNLGPTDPKKQLHLSISLKLHNEAELNLMLTAINDPNSPQYHHYISTDQFKQRYSPSDSEVQQVVAFLKSQNITVIDISPNNTLIDASCTVAQAEQAFDVHINNYHFKHLTYYANAEEPTVPTSVSALILAISGLDNAAKGHPESLNFV
jgi:subtilase family serine protease